MCHFSGIAILVLCSISFVQSQTDSCAELQDEYLTCAENAGEPLATQCKVDCLTDGLIELDVSASCVELSANICSFVEACLQGCAAENTACVGQEASYTSCSFGAEFAENCIITCDGTGTGTGNSGDDSNGGDNSGGDSGGGSGGNGHNGGGGINDADDLKRSTSAGSSRATTIARPVLVAALLVAAGLTV